MRQHILDLDSIYGKVYPNKINKQIISITTNKSIAKIVKIEKMTERNALKIYYNVTNKDAKGRKLWFKFRDNQLYCYVDGKIVEKPIKSESEVRRATINSKVKPDLYKAFKTTCKFLGTNPSKVINEFVEKFVKENEPVIRYYLSNIDKGGNNNGRKD